MSETFGLLLGMSVLFGLAFMLMTVTDCEKSVHPLIAQIYMWIGLGFLACIIGMLILISIAFIRTIVNL
jgi:hypothetical protein